MLPTDESGDITTIENVFHSLNTRLNGIKNANIDLGDLMSGYGYSYQDSIFEINNKYFAFSPTKVLGEVNYSLGLINRIQESTPNLIDNKSNQVQDSWLNDQSQFDKIKEELTHYAQFLERIREELLIRLNSTETNATVNSEKIKINITIEQLGGLIYYLNNERNFSGNVKIFKADLTQLCKSFSTILCKADGNEIAFDPLYNSVSALKNNASIINFWKDKFIRYMNHSIELLKK